MPIQNSHNNNLDELIIRNLPSPSTAFLIVSEWYSQGRYDAVINACRDILKIYPDDIRLHRLACLAYSELDFQQEVLNETEKIMRSIEDFADIYLIRARTLKQLNEIGKALKTLRLYLAYRPGDETGLALLKELRATDGSLDSPGQEPADIDLGPETTMASPTIAELYLSQGLIDQAVETYRHVVALNPDDESSRQRLEELEMEASRVQENRRKQVQFSDESVCRTLLEQWREKCRKLLETKV
jgi:tetratricopeptide (TPR) repeat protein